MAKTVDKITNHAELAAQALIEQYREATNLNNLVDIAGDRAQQLEDVAYQILTERSLDMAVGAQLDDLGVLLDLVRAGRNDEEYRKALNTQILVQRSDGSASAIGAVVDTLLDIAFSIIDEGRCSFSIELDDTIGNIQVRDVSTFVASSKVAGVEGSVLWNPSNVENKLEFQPQTTLSGAESIGATAFNVGDTSDFPSTGTLIFCGGTYEEKDYTSKTATTFTINPGLQYNQPAGTAVVYKDFAAPGLGIINKCLWSEDLSNAVWDKNPSNTFTINSDIDPDGGSTAERVDPLGKLLELDFTTTSLPAAVDTYTRAGEIACVTGSDASGETVTKFSSGTYAYLYDSSFSHASKLAGYFHPAITNLILQSENWSVAPWTRSGGLFGGATFTAPDGSLSATKITGGNNIEQTFNTTVGKNYNVSCWIRAAVGTVGTLELQDSSGTTISSTAITSDNLWRRVDVSGTATTTTSKLKVVWTTGGLIYYWGGQATTPSISGSTDGPFGYVPTTVSTATCPETVCEVSSVYDKGFWNHGFGQCDITYMPMSGYHSTNSILGAFYPDSGAANLKYFRNNVGTIKWYDNSGSFWFNKTIATDSTYLDSAVKVEYAWDGPGGMTGGVDGRITVDGGTPVTTDVGTFTYGTNDGKLTIGSYIASANHHHCAISNITVYEKYDSFLDYNYKQDISTTASSAYDFSLYVKRADTGVPATGDLSFRDSSGTLIGSVYPFAATDSWVRHDIARTTTDTTTQAVVHGLDGSVLFAFHQFEEGATANTYVKSEGSPGGTSSGRVNDKNTFSRYPFHLPYTADDFGDALGITAPSEEVMVINDLHSDPAEWKERVSGTGMVTSVYTLGGVSSPFKAFPGMYVPGGSSDYYTFVNSLAKGVPGGNSFALIWVGILPESGSNGYLISNGASTPYYRILTTGSGASKQVELQVSSGPTSTIDFDSAAKFGGFDDQRPVMLVGIVNQTANTLSGYYYHPDTGVVTSPSAGPSFSSFGSNGHFRLGDAGALGSGASALHLAAAYLEGSEVESIDSDAVARLASQLRLDDIQRSTEGIMVSALNIASGDLIDLSSGDYPAQSSQLYREPPRKEERIYPTVSGLTDIYGHVPSAYFVCTSEEPKDLVGGTDTLTLGTGAVLATSEELNTLHNYCVANYSGAVYAAAGDYVASEGVDLFMGNLGSLGVSSQESGGTDVRHIFGRYDAASSVSNPGRSVYVGSDYIAARIEDNSGSSNVEYISTSSLGSIGDDTPIIIQHVYSPTYHRLIIWYKGKIVKSSATSNHGVTMVESTSPGRLRFGSSDGIELDSAKVRCVGLATWNGIDVDTLDGWEVDKLASFCKLQ